MYNAVKSQQILQPLGSGVPMRSSMSSLSPGQSGLHRKQSWRGNNDRLTTLKRGSIRGLQTILNAPAGSSPYSSNSSIDGRVSPSPSFATSAHEVILSFRFREPCLFSIQAGTIRTKLVLPHPNSRICFKSLAHYNQRGSRGRPQHS